MSTVAKIFSTVLNNRITKHLYENGLLCNEQNGFRKLRSCLDHIYTLTSIVRNRKLQKLPTYILKRKRNATIYILVFFYIAHVRIFLKVYFMSLHNVS